MTALVFSGLILAYIISGALYSSIKQVQFEDTMPFIFILRDLLLAILIAAFWQIFLTDYYIKKMRYYLRIILFVGTLSILLLGFFAIFYVAPVDWAKLWLIIAGLFVLLIAIISIACELYFRKTGKQYTEILEKYKKKRGM
jgi:magnesium-transporting ATPase (P-type)